MSTVLDVHLPRQQRVTPAIAIAVVLSLLAHFALLLWLPPLRKPADQPPSPPPLTAYLREAPQPEPEPAAEAKPPEPQPAPRSEPAPAPQITRVPMTPQQQPAPPPKPNPLPAQQPQASPQPTRQPPPAPTAPDPVIALSKPATPEKPPEFTVPAQPKVEPPPLKPELPSKPEPPPLAQIPQLTTPPPAEADFMAALEAKRRARGEAPADTPSPEVERANRGALASAALKQPASPVITPEKPRNGYGSFDIRRRGYDYAEFMFKGWNENFRREGLQLIDVKKGDNNDIDIAVVRSIIAIIRRTESGDFTWYSHRLKKALTLSARPRDNGILEEFILQEFYDDLHRYR